jgi:hypothetical protein
LKFINDTKWLSLITETYLEGLNAHNMAIGPGTCLGSPADMVSVAAVPPDRDVAGSADYHDAPYQRQDRQRGARSELWIEVIWFL